MFTPSSGNVFADLGLPNAKELLAKADLLIEIADFIKRSRAAREQVARMMGAPSSRLQEVLDLDLELFSLKRLRRIHKEAGQCSKGENANTKRITSKATGRKAEKGSKPPSSPRPTRTPER